MNPISVSLRIPNDVNGPRILWPFFTYHFGFRGLVIPPPPSVSTPGVGIRQPSQRAVCHNLITPVRVCHRRGAAARGNRSALPGGLPWLQRPLGVVSRVAVPKE
jgi:hypothetical protein